MAGSRGKLTRKEAIAWVRSMAYVFGIVEMDGDKIYDLFDGMYDRLYGPGSEVMQHEVYTSL